ncbi:MAG: tetratricopeptide repeat protein, partial [Bacteroidota bacterium]
MYTRLLLSTLLLCSVTYLHAQSSYVTEKTVKGKVKKQFEKAKQYAFERSYERAISELTKVLKVAPNFVDAIIDRAEIHYDQKRFAAAEQDFEQAIILAPDYKARVYYMLGLAEMRQDKHLEAAAHFEYYANNTSTRNEKRKAKARRYQASALFLDQALKNPVPYRPERLSDNINTPYAEYLPTFTADEEI